MNRQSRITLFLLCSLFAFKFGYQDYYVFERQFTETKEVKKEVRRVEKMQEMKRSFGVINTAYLDAHAQFIGNSEFKERSQVVLVQLSGSTTKKLNSSFENSQCRDP